MVDEAIKLITKGVGKKIAWLWFLESYNEPSLLHQINPEKYRRHRKSYQKLKRGHTSEKTKSLRAIHKVTGNTNKISDCFKFWNTLNFFDLKTTEPSRMGKNEKEHYYPLKIYQFNMNPFFYFHKEFTEKQKKILDFLFYPVWVRYCIKNEFKKDNLIEAISKFYITHILTISSDDRKKPKSDFKFPKEFFHFDDSSYRDEWVMKPKVKLVKLKFSNGKPSKTLKICDDNWNEYNKYLSGPILKPEEEKDRIKITSDSFISLYLCLYKYYKEDMDELDSLMVRTLDLNKL